MNSEIFTRVLFSRNFAYAKFRENKILMKWRNHSVVYLYRYITPLSRISTSKICVLTLSAKIPGRVAQSVTCLATDACLTADPRVASSIPARYHTFVEIDHEIISTVILLPSAD